MMNFIERNVYGNVHGRRKCDSYGMVWYGMVWYGMVWYHTTGNPLWPNVSAVNHFRTVEAIVFHPTDGFSCYIYQTKACDLLFLFITD